MTDREKLIERIRYAPKVKLPFGGRANGKEYQTAASIADHILADGWIRPPCKVGDIFYRKIIAYNKPCIDELKVSSLTIKADGSYKIRLTSGRYRSVFEVTPNTLRQTAFPSLEDAEKALEERKENEWWKI